MSDVGFREMGSFVPGARREEPTVAPPSRTAVPPVEHTSDTSVIVTPPPPKRRALLGGERMDGEDVLGMTPLLGRLAELIVHGRTATPLTIGLLGAPGTGKSFALDRTTGFARDLASAAGKVNASPFLSRLHVQKIDAAALDGDIGGSLAACVHAGLQHAYPELARDIAHTARDPNIVLGEVSDRLDDARRRLDSERRALDEAGSRRARLTETVLFEGAGSQVDAFARANRAGIEARLAGFGIGGDPIRSYKELVQYVAGSGGRFGLALRSLWAFKGQSKLIVAAIVLCVVAVGLGTAIDDQTSWLGSLRSGSQAGPAVATWAVAHVGWLATARTAAFALAGLAVLANLGRAFAFFAPISKGARLLVSDLDTRRRDLDGLYAHGAKRVDTLESDVDRLTRDVGAAEKRVGGPDAVARHGPSPFAAPAAVQAQGFFDSLAAAMTGGKGTKAPQRIVLAVDHLDAVAPQRACAILDALHRAAGAGLVSLVAIDPGHLDDVGRARVARWLDVPVRLDADADRIDRRSLVAHMLGRTAPAPAARPTATESALDTALGDDEAELLSTISPLAGDSPRAVKRFVSLYTLGRLDGGAPRGAVALMLALSQGGTSAEKAAVATALADGESGSAAGFGLPAHASHRLAAAFAAAHEFDGSFESRQAIAAARTAARYAPAHEYSVERGTEGPSISPAG